MSYRHLWQALSLPFLILGQKNKPIYGRFILGKHFCRTLLSCVFN
nr:MAG TPA: hypothetical protein [Bacteriophage sp.]